MTVVSNGLRDAESSDGSVTKKPIFFLWFEPFSIRAVDVLGDKVVVRCALICIVSWDVFVHT